MTTSVDRVKALADAVLYEGYLLYPYRASALENRPRWCFGGVEPGGSLGCDFLLEGGQRLHITLRFLHLGAGELRAMPRELRLQAPLADRDWPFAVAASHDTPAALSGVLGLRVAPLSLAVDNTSPPHPLAVLASTHALLRVDGGRFLSAQDPPALRCRSNGAWPILVEDQLLVSPILLEDQPQLAEESPGDFYDAAEIDERLALRVRTLGKAEKAGIRAGDPRAAEILARSEALDPGALARLHGRLRRGLSPGSRVRIRPRPGADAIDGLLAGREAIVVERRAEVGGREHVVVRLVDDPGGDEAIAHRFYFAPGELEVLA